MWLIGNDWVSYLDNGFSRSLSLNSLSKSSNVICRIVGSTFFSLYTCVSWTVYLMHHCQHHYSCCCMHNKLARCNLTKNKNFFISSFIYQIILFIFCCVVYIWLLSFYFRLVWFGHCTHLAGKEFMHNLKSDWNISLG